MPMFENDKKGSDSSYLYNSRIELSVQVSALISKYYSHEISLNEFLIHPFYVLWKEKWKEKERSGNYPVIKSSSTCATYFSVFQWDMNILQFLETVQVLQKETGYHSIVESVLYKTWKQEAEEFLTPKKNIKRLNSRSFY